MCVAMSVQREQAAAQDVVAAKILKRPIAVNSKIFRGTSKVRGDHDGSAPAFVSSGKELRGLTQLRALPTHAELPPRLPEGTRALPGSVDIDLACIAQIEIRPHRTSFEPH